MKETCMLKYGVDHPMKYKDNAQKIAGKWSDERRNNFNNKIKEISLQKYNTNSPNQAREVCLKQQCRYIYNNITFDSSWELAYYIWLTDNNILFEYQLNIKFEYLFNNKQHFYLPDFKVNDDYVEIKGLQFFKNKDALDIMINPYTKNQDGLLEAKHKCMLQNNIIIITDCSLYLKYVNDKYGKNYLKSFKKHK